MKLLTLFESTKTIYLRSEILIVKNINSFYSHLIHNHTWKKKGEREKYV